MFQNVPIPCSEGFPMFQDCTHTTTQNHHLPIEKREMQKKQHIFFESGLGARFRRFYKVWAPPLCGGGISQSRTLPAFSYRHRVNKQNRTRSTSYRIKWIFLVDLAIGHPLLLYQTFQNLHRRLGGESTREIVSCRVMRACVRARCLVS